MKKILKVIIILAVILGIGGFIYYVFSETTPIDDTKKLYVSCNNNHEHYDVLTGTKITFAEKSSDCKLDFDIRNVDRNYIKLKTSVYFYELDGNNNINENVTFNELFIAPNETLIVYTLDKTTKYEFQYK